MTKTIEDERELNEKAMEIIRQLSDPDENNGDLIRLIKFNSYLPPKEVVDIKRRIREILANVQLPKEVIPKTWKCPVCNKTEVWYGETCGCSESKKVSSDKGIGISEIANQEANDVSRK